MADYTYKELMKMQSDAIRRAEDMQMRARRSAGFEDGENKDKNTLPAQEPKRIQMPGGLDYGAESSKRHPPAPSASHNDFFEKIKSGLGDINIDSDKALLLSLIMLLSEEQADELLIMALIYMLG